MTGFSPDSSTTGATVASYLTNPTYTLAADAQDANSKSYAVTALGGTQTNVRAHTAGDPFTASIRRFPYKAKPAANPVTGAYPNVPMNRKEIFVRKGLKIDSAGTIRVGNVRISIELPAGCETSDAVNVAAMASFSIGLLNEESADLVDTLITGLFG